MTTIIPSEELLRRAVAWINEARKEKAQPLPALIEQAAMKFNLGPKDSEFLERFFKENKNPETL